MANNEMRYVIIGASAAGMAAAEAIRRVDSSGVITVLSEEPVMPYFRPMIPFLISGKKSAADMALIGQGPYSGTGIEVRLNSRAEGVDTTNQTVMVQGGDQIHYDRLLLATGSRPYIPPEINGTESEGVFALRSLTDATAAADRAAKADHVVMLGGGLLNLNGELIGINVAVVQNSQSIGFAIPVEKVKAALAEYERNKNIAIKRKTQIFPRKKTQQRPRQPVVDRDEWDPFAEMKRMQDRMNRIFDDSFEDEFFGRGGSGAFNTNLFYDKDFSFKETDNAYTLNLDISNLNKDKIDIEIHDNYITISGQYSGETEESSPEIYFKSKRMGSFMKTIPVPDNADVEQMTTEKVGEELVVTIPKK